jgi:hypothetical protein
MFHFQQIMIMYKNLHIDTECSIICLLIEKIGGKNEKFKTN